MKDAQARGENWKVKWNSLGSTRMVCHAHHHYYILATIGLAIINTFLQQQENSFYFILCFYILKKFKACLGFCVLVFWV
jgi:hypothetical protein